MKVLDCRSVRSQIDEAEFGCEPSAMLNIHLQACPECRDFFDESQKLRHVVASLGHIEAPADFDFRLRARLNATASPRSFLPRLRFVVPTAVAAVILLIAAISLIDSRKVEPPVIEANNIETVPVAAPVERVTASDQRIEPPRGTPASLQDDGNRSVRRQAAVRGRSRPATKEFSNLPAPVVRNESVIAAAPPVFPVDGSPQALKVSLEDGNGAYRTISVPRVSFGSQRAFGDQPTFVKTSSSGIW